MNKHNLKQLEVYATIKLDTNGHPFYIIVDHENMLTLDTHAIYYEHIAIETSEAVYHLEEDYSITVIHGEVYRIGS